MQAPTTTVKDVMSTEVLTVHEGMAAEELAAFFKENEISGAPVVDDDGQLVGVVSLKDLVRCLAGSHNVAPDRSDPDYFLREWEEHFNPEDLKALRVVDTEATVGELMSRTIYSVSEETDARTCAREMLEHRVHRLLVTTDGQLRGIVSAFDLLRLVAE